MKKVGIITIHKSHNYGAVLQAFATQRIFNSVGCETQFIDYETTASKHDKTFLRCSFSVNSIKHNIRNILHPFLFFKRRKNFEKFINNYLNIGEKQYNSHNIEQLKNAGYDVIVTGSDQTFNLMLKGDSDERLPYLLPFEFSGKKISFSSSFGDSVDKFTPEHKETLKKYLSDYDALSVREKNGADFIENLIGKRPQETFDPTLSLTQSEWDSVASQEKNKNGKYILFYTVVSAPWVVEYVKKISEQTGLKVLAMHPQNQFEIGCNFKRVCHGGPAEFINYIKNAEYVLTTSFHGTVFSMIYQKPFYSFVLGNTGRINGLLNKAKLEHRIVTPQKQADKLLVDNDDVIKAKSFLQNAREININFLKSEISNIKEN